MYVCMYVCMYVSMYAYIYIYIYICICTYFYLSDRMQTLLKMLTANVTFIFRRFIVSLYVYVGL